MSDRIVIGIDTSNYTTSISILGVDGRLIANIKRLLPVKAGECGLRQSDAVFAHVKNIPVIMKEVATHLADREVCAVGVSSRPRNLEGSYMPCFLTGVALAEGIARTHNVPLYTFSHQCGHIMAALYSSKQEKLLGESFAAFHVSGGTTELLKVKGTGDGFCTELVGGTKDLNAGQVIDRIGVHLGLPFPAGMYLENEASRYTGRVYKAKVSVSGTYANLSGLENMAVNLYNETNDPSATAAFVFEFIGNSILKMCDNYIEEYGESKFVFAGGVMCNTIIKSKLSGRFDACFAEPMMSSDNAVGIAALALHRYFNKRL